MKVMILSPQSTQASEKAKKPGDNASFRIIKELRLLGCNIIGSEVAQLPNNKPVPLDRRRKAIELHREADITLIMGSDTLRNIKSWFPVSEAIQVPQPFFYISDPGRIEIELLEKIKENYTPGNTIYGFNPLTNEIGGAI